VAFSVLKGIWRKNPLSVVVRGSRDDQEASLPLWALVAKQVRLFFVSEPVVRRQRPKLTVRSLCAVPRIRWMRC